MKRAASFSGVVSCFAQIITLSGQTGLRRRGKRQTTAAPYPRGDRAASVAKLSITYHIS